MTLSRTATPLQGRWRAQRGSRVGGEPKRPRESLVDERWFDRADARGTAVPESGSEGGGEMKE